MTYYLDTNLIYNLRNIPSNILKDCFTSILTLIELVSGLKDETSYIKRKNILRLVFSLKLTIDWAMPEEIIFNSFDFFDEAELGDDRVEKLISLIDCLIQSNSYEDYTNSETYTSDYGHAYFKAIDDTISKGFVVNTESAIQAMKHSLTTDIGLNTVVMDDQSYVIDTAKALGIFFEIYPEVNRGITINGLANMLITTLGLVDVSIEHVFESYNGLVNIYVEAMSTYCIYKITNHQMPAKNDFSDLTHLLYMKNVPYRKMVSDDALFKTYLKEQVVDFKWLKSVNQI